MLRCDGLMEAAEAGERTSKPPSIAACMAGAHCSALGVRSTAHALYLAKVSMTFVTDSGDFIYAADFIVRRAMRRAIVGRTEARRASIERRRDAV